MAGKEVAADGRQYGSEIPDAPSRLRTWRCLRVEFKTDSLNERSRAALLRIGAKEEGIFRNHVITWTGRIRHSVYYSIVDSEWPAVKAHLQHKLQRA